MTEQTLATGSMIVDATLLSYGRRLLLQQMDAAAVQEIVMCAGHAQGWLTAEREDARGVDSAAALWRAAAQGGQSVGLGAPAADWDDPNGLDWVNSVEVENHQRTGNGESTAPVCWFLTGFFAGYLSRHRGRIECVEAHCAAQGHARCRFVVRPATMGREGAAEPDDELQDDSDAEDDAAGLGARSTAMRDIVAHARRVAGADSTVLITGESGVGKERLAAFIHEQSTRAGRIFLPLNCGAVGDSTLLESELFGHRRGAFTGATEEHRGLFEAAEGGTLFLDEIGEVPAAVQVKLLRVLQEREVRRVGDTQYRRINVRLLAATNRDLQREVQDGRFRADLFFRLNVVALHVPPLRERPEDLRLLLRRALARLSQKLRRPISGYTPRALHALLRYPWPGNIRELENALESACLLTDDPLIDLRHLPASVRAIAAALPPMSARHGVGTLRAVKRAHILNVLRQAGNNKKLAAERLGISESTLQRELKRTARDIRQPPRDREE